MAGSRRKPASQRELEGNSEHRPIPPEVDFTAAGEISGPPDWLDKIRAGAGRWSVQRQGVVPTFRRLPRWCAENNGVKVLANPLSFDFMNQKEHPAIAGRAPCVKVDLLLGVVDGNSLVFSRAGMGFRITLGNEAASDGAAINRFGWDRLCHGREALLGAKANGERLSLLVRASDTN